MTGDSTHLIDVYRRFSFVPHRGEGSFLFAADGSRVLDFSSGIATTALGHRHPALMAALERQADLLWHCSNLLPVPGQEDLAGRLCARSFAERVFFANTGLEAIEALLKLVRGARAAVGDHCRRTVITFQGSFHGRSLATISAAGDPRLCQGFGPLLPGFVTVPPDDREAVARAVDETTTAILIEPVQGDGGIRVIPPDFLVFLRELCDRHGLFLALDEVQCGVGRTGRLWCHEHAGVCPDVMAVAKGLGGGFPVAAVLASADVARGFPPGSHGSTLGGNPLAMAVASAVLGVVCADGFLAEVAGRAARLSAGLHDLSRRAAGVFPEVRGIGLLCGLRCTPPARDVASALLAAGLLTAPAAGDNVIRLLPPLNVSDGEIDTALDLLSAVAADLAGSGS